MSVRQSATNGDENARERPRIVDLHVHTTVSDGLSEPAELMRAMAEAGVTLAALTDHDAMGGVGEARAAAEGCGMGFLAGVEISAGNRDHLHILGLGVDAQAIADVLADARMRRRARIGEMIARLEAQGIPMESARARNQENTERAASRMMLARDLIARGFARDTKDVFARFLGPGCRAYVGLENLAPERVIGRIHGAGGLAILAHPGRLRLDFSGREDFVRELARAGLDGLEVWHPSHDADAAAFWRGVADRAGLMITAGSDFHGLAGDYTLRPALPRGEAERIQGAFDGSLRQIAPKKRTSAWPKG